jgi:Predicted unsaturated glucuronyl hydrolase involved in regulation of bacterial surface properties, and related proteins
VATGGTAVNTGGAATGGATGGTSGNTGGAATGGATGGTAGSGSPTGGATGGTRTGGTTGSSATAGGTGGVRTGGTAGSSSTGGAAGGGATGGTAGSGGTGGVGGSTLIGGPGPAAQVITQTGVDWGKLVIDTTMAGKTTLGVTYPEGLMLHGVSKAYKRLKDPKYLTFLTASVDSWLPTPTAFVSLDDLMHNVAVADAYELAPKASYKTYADAARAHYNGFPITADGAFWHANRTDRAHQLWGDGVFMSLSFLTRYATVFNDPTVYPIAVTNLTVTATHLKNAATGLLWHAYDESGVATWSKTASKTNEISWGRAMGWYVMACVMTLEMLPANDPGRAQIETILKDLITALAKYQDAATGRWFQVVDMGTDSRNWTETSCGMMYSYATWWSYQHGLVDATFADVAKKGLDGVLQKVTKNASNQTTITGTCTGLNASAAVADYFSHATASNDNHGTGAFVLMWEGLQ